MCQPEWEDADFEGEVIASLPDWSRVDLKGFKRPEWYKQKIIIQPPWRQGSSPFISYPVKTILPTLTRCKMPSNRKELL
jgi:hypothetical protein